MTAEVHAKARIEHSAAGAPLGEIFVSLRKLACKAFHPKFPSSRETGHFPSVPGLFGKVRVRHVKLSHRLT